MPKAEAVSLYDRESDKELRQTVQEDIQRPARAHQEAPQEDELRPPFMAAYFVFGGSAGLPYVFIPTVLIWFST